MALGRGERAAVHALENRLERLEGPGEPEIGEHAAQSVAARGCGLHTAPATAAEYTLSGRFSTAIRGWGETGR